MLIQGHTREVSPREATEEGVHDLSSMDRKEGIHLTEEKVGQGHIPIHRREDERWVPMMTGLSIRLEIDQTIRELPETMIVDMRGPPMRGSIPETMVFTRVNRTMLRSMKKCAQMIMKVPHIIGRKTEEVGNRHLNIGIKVENICQQVLIISRIQEVQGEVKFDTKGSMSEITEKEAQRTDTSRR